MILLLLKTFSIIVTLVVLFAALLIGIELRRLNTKVIEEFVGLRSSRKKAPPADQPAPAGEPAPVQSLRSEAQRQWQGLRAALDSGHKEALQLAVLHLDAFFDTALKMHGYSGNDMGERLKEASLDRVPSIERLWTAHKIRNRIAHEPGSVSAEELKEALGWYEVVLKDWRLIQ